MKPRFRALLPHEQSECLQLWTQVFTPGDTYFVRYFEDPLWKPDYTRVCEVDGKLVAAVQIVRRAVRLNGQQVWMAGIANVATLPEYRGRGFASQLLRDAQEVIDSEDFLFGLLFTGIHDFYARLGWHMLELPLPVSAPHPLPIEPRWRFRSAELEDLPQVRRWHDRTYADHPFTVVRDEQYWRVWVRWEDDEWRRSFYIAEYEDEPLGYMAIETHYRRLEDGSRRVEALSMTELGADALEPPIVEAMLGFVNEMALGAGAEQIRWFVSLPEAERLLRPRLPSMQFVPQRHPMVRVGNRERLWQAFETLEGGTPPAELESLSDADALRLLFGLYHESTPPSVSPALVRRYPPRPALYLPADSF
jgi:ribosomal protein S18 acetylase RimI-like enzyme